MEPIFAKIKNCLSEMFRTSL